MNWRDIGSRALKTFVQSLLAALSVTALVNGDLTNVKPAAIAAAAAGISVVWNAVLQWSQS